MSEWKEISPPKLDTELGDHEVAKKGSHLKGKKIALLTTGSIAAITVPSLARELRKYGADVQIFATDDALKCGVGKLALEWSSWPNKVVIELTGASEHLSLGNPFDLYLVAPATSNTICKTACGISDTIVTGALASALGRKIPIMMVPAMHGSLHNEFFEQSVIKLKKAGIFFMQPYDAYGKHNMQDKNAIVMDACRMLSSSPLVGKRIMVTAGPTPVKIDSVRLITNKFSGKLGIMIAEDLQRRGANVMLYQSYSGVRPPKYIPNKLFMDFYEYANLVIKEAESYDIGVFSAAVADYMPKEILKGKTPSKGGLKSIELTETFKVIDKVLELENHPMMVSFKYEEGCGIPGLKRIAKKRIEEFGHDIIVATDGLLAIDGKQVARIFRKRNLNDMFQDYNDIIGKSEIATNLSKAIEDQLTCNY